MTSEVRKYVGKYISSVSTRAIQPKIIIQTYLSTVRGWVAISSPLCWTVCKEEAFTSMERSYMVSHENPIREMKTEILEMYFLGK